MSCLRPVEIPYYRVERVPHKVVIEKELYKQFRLQKVKHYIQVPCGKCPACLARQQMEWSFRIESEVLSPWVVNALFVTLTYAPYYLPRDRSVNKVHLQKYFKRLRTNLEREYGYRIQLSYYACGEYGDKFGRPHYHYIIALSRSVDWRILQRSWRMGIVDIAPFSPARAGYVAKYSMKQFGINYQGFTAPFRLVSKGLGKSFLKRVSPSRIGYVSTFRNISGHVVHLHRYYLDKLYPHYKREYTVVKSAFSKDGTTRVSSRVDVSTSDRWYYLRNAQALYDKYVGLQTSANANGYLGFLRDKFNSAINKLSFGTFSLIEKQCLKW